MKKILYMLHVPWGWIKQRPHFIAEGLSQSFEVCIVVEKYYIHKNRYVKNDTQSNLKFKELFKLPHINLNFFLKINSIIVQYQLKRMINNYDFIWLIHPNLFSRIRTIVPKTSKVIYDCMDDVLEFPYVKSHPNLKQLTFTNEKELIDRSDIIFTSSDYLKQKLQKRYNIRKKIFVVNNAIFIKNEKNISINLTNNLPFNIENNLHKTGINIIYTGAISDWIDFKLILESLKEFKNINYIFFGHSEIKLPRHERIIYAGPVEHKYIFDIMRKSDALIMPFKINELVLSIDPVKLYEYIYSCKPSIAIDYGETQKFKDFVYLYRSTDEYFTIIKNLAENNLNLKKSCEEYKQFAENNTWDKRVKYMAEKIM